MKFQSLVTSGHYKDLLFVLNYLNVPYKDLINVARIDMDEDEFRDLLAKHNIRYKTMSQNYYKHTFLQIEDGIWHVSLINEFFKNTNNG